MWRARPTISAPGRVPFRRKTLTLHPVVRVAGLDVLVQLAAEVEARVAGNSGVLEEAGVNRAQDRYPFDRMVGARFTLDKINDAFEQSEWAAGKGSVARTVVMR